MKKLVLDMGVQEFKIQGGGVLRFHPGDPNLYARFLQAEEKLSAMEQELTRQTKDICDAQGMLVLLGQADKQLKALLTEIFGEENDFDKALGGVNLLSVAGNGKTVAANLMGALEKILTQGAQRFADARVAEIKAARKSL